MAKPIKLKKEETATDLYECSCGQTQAGELMRCPTCHRHLCDNCMYYGPGVSCVDCELGMDEVE